MIMYTIFDSTPSFAVKPSMFTLHSLLIRCFMVTKYICRFKLIQSSLCNVYVHIQGRTNDCRAHELIAVTGFFNAGLHVG